LREKVYLTPNIYKKEFYEILNPDISVWQYMYRKDTVNAGQFLSDAFGGNSASGEAYSLILHSILIM
jgi:hypothetical protein